MKWNTILGFFNSSGIKIKIAIILFLLVLIILIIIAIVGVISLTKNRKRKEKNKKEPKKIEKNPEKELLLFDKKIKDYFKGYLKLDSEVGYTKIAEKLREKNKHALANFCDRMNYSLYSEKKIDEEDIKALKKHFRNITHIKKTKKKKPIKKSIKKKKKV